MNQSLVGSRAEPGASDSAPLDVSVRNHGPSAWIVDVRGELDLATGPILTQHLASHANTHGGHPRRVAYRLPGLTFMDMGGLRALLDAVAPHGPDTITIRKPSGQVRRVLQLVGLSSMIEEPTNR